MQSQHQSPPAWPIRIGVSRHGLGLFATRDLSPTSQILVFDGPEISFERMLCKREHEANALQIARNCYLDLTPPGVYANHSCQPNAGIKQNRILIALQRIKAGEEITYDYSTTMLENHWTMPCHCGTEACRKLIEDFPKLPQKIQNNYLELGIVQDFIVRNTSKQRGFWLNR